MAHTGSLFHLIGVETRMACCYVLTDENDGALLWIEPVSGCWAISFRLAHKKGGPGLSPARLSFVYGTVDGGPRPF